MKNLRFDLSVIECNGWPKIEVFLDGQPCFEKFLDTHDYSFVIDKELTPGFHTLVIKRSNKNIENVQIHNGERKDQSVSVKNIWWENVKLPEYFLYHGKFYFNDNDGKEIFTNTPTMGPNGRWCWVFKAPVLDWIINNNKKQQQDIKDIVNAVTKI